MPRKELSDFNYNYQAYADYLESPECANDEGYDTLVDYNGNIYEATDGDWQKGHGHKNVYNGYDRDKDDEKSKGRPWKNPWLKYNENLILTQSDAELICTFSDSEIKKNISLTKSFQKSK